MRKIKITALLLAVLMIVTAFAGCASKSTVENLDNKVNDLDNKIQEQADALAGIQDSLKDISDALGNQGSSELDDIKADVEANKQNVADILAAIEGLKDALAGATGDNEDVKVAISKAGAEIDALKGVYADNRGHYVKATYDAIVAILGDAQASISTCVTTDAVAAVLADMETKLAAQKRVDDALYEYVVALKGNITDDSADLVEEAMEALEAAEEFYEDNMEALTEYKVGETTIDLQEAIEDLDEDQNETLPDIKTRAKTIVRDIEREIKDYNVYNLEAIYRTYKAWVKDAKKLSPENVKLVTNYDKLEEALDDALEVSTAINEFFSAVWEYESLINDAYDVYIFGDYEELKWNDQQAVITFTNADDKIVRTTKIYDAIDARLADFKEEYALGDAAFEYVIDSCMGDDFLAKYEADKALTVAFVAEYEKLADGVFAAIKALNGKKVTATSALDLVNAFKKNRDDIVAWATGLNKAYKAACEKDADAPRNYTADMYWALIRDNFNAMVVEAKLCVFHKAEGNTPAYYEPYTYGLDYTAAGNEYYYALYDFSNNADLATFLTVTFPAANDAAEEINAKINDLVVARQNSIVALVAGIGGYVKVGTDADGDAALVAVDLEEDDYNAGTIAAFVAEYNKYGLAGMIDTATYEAKLAAIEKNVENADAAMKALMDALLAIVNGKDAVVVTLDNANKIIALEALLQKWLSVGRVDTLKATASNTTVAGIQEYKLAYVLDAYTEDRDAFYEAVLLPVDYSKTNLSTDVDTGMIVRLIYQAKTLKAEAAMVASVYEMIQKLNATGAFSFANNQNGAAEVNGVYAADEADLFMYGVISNTASGSGTSYTNKAKAVGYKDGKFVELEITGSGSTAANALADLKTKLAAAAFGAAIEGNTPEEKNYNLANYLFGAADVDGTLANFVATTDYEALAGIINNKVIPAYVLPMLAMYLEVKFEINNMGAESADVETAKNGWGAEDSSYGFEYIQAMTVARLRYNDTVSFSTLELNAVAAATTYEELRVAVNAAVEHSNWDADIAFGAGDASWLAKTYDITVRDYANGEYEATPYTYAALGYDLSKLDFAVLSIFVAD